ncbi:MAG: hypothetical protein HYV07_30050 [Deltaproteobacteria bacterium]|nr:hypothetical protein [Deltaproteobacteria bacterium]
MPWALLKKLATIALVVWFLMKLIGACSGPEATKNPLAYLVNRPWVDHVPKSDRDLVTHLMLFEQRSIRLGVVGQASRWRTIRDHLRFKIEGEKVVMEFPQEQKKISFHAKTWTCKEAPEPFDLCLELAHPGKKPIRLYSRSRWRFQEEGIDADEVPDGLRSQLKDLAEVRYRELPEPSAPATEDIPESLRGLLEFAAPGRSESPSASPPVWRGDASQSDRPAGSLRSPQ